MNRYSPTAHYRLVAPIDLSGICWGTAVVNRFGGVFDGNHLTISHLTISPPESAGKEDVGLFGQLTWGAEVRNLGVTDVNVTGAGQYTGGLAGQSDASDTRMLQHRVNAGQVRYWNGRALCRRLGWE